MRIILIGRGKMGRLIRETAESTGDEVVAALGHDDLARLDSMGRVADVVIDFSRPEALDAVADQAIQRNIGARGLRAVMEGLLTRIMYEIPSDPTITRVTITPEAVLKTGEPEITRDPQRTERPGRTRDGKVEHDSSAPAS